MTATLPVTVGRAGTDGEAGSYGSSLATRYNGRPRPAEVFIGPSGDLELARARQQVS